MIKQRFNNMNLQSKLMLSHFILIAIPTIVLTIVFYTQIYDVIVSNTIRQEQAVSDQTSMTLDTLLSQVIKTSKTLQENSYLTNILNDTSDTHDISAAVPDKEKYNFSSFIKSQIDGDLITDIKIYTDQLTPRTYTENFSSKIFLPLSESNGSYWNGIFAGTKKSALFCPAFYLSSKELYNYGTLAYIERINTLNEAGTYETSYIAIYFSEDTLNSTLKQDISVNNSVSYIVNERDSLVAASNKSLVGTYIMNYKTITDIALSSSGFITKKVLDQEVYTGCYNIRGTDWYMVSILPASPILARGNSIIITLAGLYLIMLLVAFIIAYKLSRSITIRVENVSNQMRTVRLGKPVRMENATVHDEIGDLVDTYNYMTDEMNMLLDTREKAAEELRIAEFKALQAQINPHFLYNTMDMINWLSKTGQSKEVTEAVQLLSRFYKLTLSKKNIIADIEQVIEHVTIYVQLQNMRYQNQIEFVVDVPDELMDFQIPKLTFQPIVENSIQHGILEKESRQGTIVLTGWLEKEDIVFLISDDGIGIKPAHLDDILTEHSAHHSTGSGSNVGVYNTHRRLRMLYGEHYGLAYSSTLGKGTEVTIRIPALRTATHPTPYDTLME